MAKSRSIKTKSRVNKILSDIILTGHGVPIGLVIIVISILFVLFRMKTVELSYKFSAVNKKIDKSIQVNKKLKGVKARLLSSESLKNYAKKHRLKEPGQEQIIVIPK